MNNDLLKNIELVLVTYFPDYRKRIESLLLKDQNFKEVAEDYLYCMHKLKQLETEKNNKLTDQYKEALQELEAELLNYLSTRK